LRPSGDREANSNNRYCRYRGELPAVRQNCSPFNETLHRRFTKRKPDRKTGEEPQRPSAVSHRQVADLVDDEERKTVRKYIERGLEPPAYGPRKPRAQRLEPCITRWEHEAVIEAMQRRLDEMPDAMRVRRSVVKHVFGTIKDWMGRDHFRTRRLANVGTEMSLHVLAYNLKRGVAVLGIPALMTAMRG